MLTFSREPKALMPAYEFESAVEFKPAIKLNSAAVLPLVSADWPKVPRSKGLQPNTGWGSQTIIPMFCLLSSVSDLSWVNWSEVVSEISKSTDNLMPYASLPSISLPV